MANASEIAWIFLILKANGPNGWDKKVLVQDCDRLCVTSFTVQGYVMTWPGYINLSTPAPAEPPQDGSVAGELRPFLFPAPQEG